MSEFMSPKTFFLTCPCTSVTVQVFKLAFQEEISETVIDFIVWTARRVCFFCLKDLKWSFKWKFLIKILSLLLVQLAFWKSTDLQINPITGEFLESGGLRTTVFRVVFCSLLRVGQLSTPINLYITTILNIVRK